MLFEQEVRYRLKMEDAQIVEDALVSAILGSSAAACCQEEVEKRRKRRKIWTLAAFCRAMFENV